jgi:hypothetical protein
MVQRFHTASTHNCRRNVAGKHVRFREMIFFSLTVGMVKDFGCRQAAKTAHARTGGAEAMVYGISGFG